MGGALKFSSLSEQVYAYLRREMISGNLFPQAQPLTSEKLLLSSVITFSLNFPSA